MESREKMRCSTMGARVWRRVWRKWVVVCVFRKRKKEEDEVQLKKFGFKWGVI